MKYCYVVAAVGTAVLPFKLQQGWQRNPIEVEQRLIFPAVF
ncbi:MAG: hypothetical protein ACK2U1_16570 [Anaerolineales bacterium]